MTALSDEDAKVLAYVCKKFRDRLREEQPAAVAVSLALKALARDTSAEALARYRWAVSSYEAKKVVRDHANERKWRFIDGTMSAEERSGVLIEAGGRGPHK